MIPKGDCFDIFKNSEPDDNTATSRYCSACRSACGYGTICHNASHPAARHKTAAASVRSWKYVHLNQCMSGSAVHGSAAKNRSWERCLNLGTGWRRVVSGTF
jgi:hypothetical protein